MTEHDRRHPDFEAGNSAALVHGTRSPQRVSEVAAAIGEIWRSAPSWPRHLDSPLYAPIVEIAQQCAARYKMLSDFLDDAPVSEWIVDRHHQVEETEQLSDAKSRTKTKGSRTRAAYDALTHAETRLINALKECGLTPMTAAKLGRTVVAADLGQAALDDMRAAGRQTRSAQSERVQALYAVDDEQGDDAS